MRKFLESVAFNNITRLAFGKRFVNSKGEMDEQGKEFKAIVSNGIKIGARHSVAEYVPWLWWIFSGAGDINEVLDKHNARRDRLSRMIMEDHTIARQKSGNTKQHFVDALLTLQKDYDLSDDTVIGLLWVSLFFLETVPKLCKFLSICTHSNVFYFILCKTSYHKLS